MQRLVVDHAGALREEIRAAEAALEPSQRSLADMDKAILSWYAGADPEESFCPAGHAYRAVITPQRNETKVTDRKLLKRLLTAAKLFDDAWQVTLTFIRSVLTEEEQKRVLTEKRTGKRSVDTVRIPN